MLTVQYTITSLPSDILQWEIFPRLNPSALLLYKIAMGREVKLDTKSKDELVEYAAKEGHLELLQCNGERRALSITS